jgi:hypothetical protein
MSGEEARRQARVDTTEKVARLRELTPELGAYMNEVSDSPPPMLAALWWRGWLMRGGVVL